MAVSLREIVTPFFAYVLFFVRTPAYGRRPATDIRRDIDRLLADQRTAVKRNDIPLSDYENACFAIVAWADELILHCAHESNRELYEHWQHSPLQVQLYSTANAGEEFFEKLARLNPSQKEIREIYHLCLCLGFRGRYYDETQDHKLVALRREHVQHLPVPFFDLYDIEKNKERVTAQPYTVAPPPPKPLPKRPSVLWAAIALPALAALVLYMLWPTPPPPAPAPVARSREEIIADVEQRLTGFDCCALTVADFQDGTAAIEGRVESEDQRLRAHEAARSVPEVTQVRDSLTIIPRPFCEVIELLQPIQRLAEDAGAGLSVRPRKGCNAVYAAGENLVIDVTGRNPLQYVYVDYYVADRQMVAHVLPSSAQRDNSLKGASTVAIGEPGSKNQWVIEPPFGLELVTAIASAQPLFPQPRLPPEAATTYIEELRRALSAGASSGETAADYCFINTGT
jgi:type VI secretion system protein ImpK